MGMDVRRVDGADKMMKCRVTEDCIACGSCTVECTAGAIIEGDLYSVDPAKCNGCGDCVRICPMDACIIEEPAVA